MHVRHDLLTIMQSNIFTAIETNNASFFIDLGGHDRVNLNFSALPNNNDKKL